ncbi:ribosyl nicotinamide transporter [Sphingomonas sp. LH128]|jgi:nicotinamide mononucleotide transporter|uniref:Nicotinamide riboside transporter PnuC n=1 Tax=Novosphingobium resinovorum TaxID=158500 RepID=A0A031JWD5_9SPHN|nr:MULTISPECIES: nicotinamide riboside transporter PnuC [Sphingomonadaceae]AOR79921.1 aminotransferase [Novosphingobium resinovorum]EJU11896.1 ribosyl nicotinamide transporter [Sphingomonas sp. LH128]EZP81209.1 Ribosyl nicotinamide transporter [Novosphingobium resinovorum]
MSILEIVAVVVSFLGIWFTARRWMLCWPVNLLACALYFKVFLDVRLYSDMVLQALFGAAILYGWAAWTRGKADSGDIVVKPLSPLGAAAGLGAGAVGAAAIGWLASRYTDAALPWMDAGLSSFSLVAQYWTARRQSASWLLWIAVDVLYVGMFAFKDLWLTAGLYAAMVALAVLGYRRWRAAAARQGRAAA